MDDEREDRRSGEGLESSSEPTQTSNVELNSALDGIRRGGVLSVIAGPEAGQTVGLEEGESVVGRSDSDDLTLHDPGVSKGHCRIFFNRAFYVEDLNSKNGTLLNGKHLDGASKLHSGDVIAIGEETLLQFSTLADDTHTESKMDEDEFAFVLEVGKQANWFRVGSGEPVDLRRRRAIRRILHALVEVAQSDEKGALGVQKLFEIGWSEDHIDPGLAADRVYWAIRTLRNEGLRGMLVTADDGYFLATDVAELRLRPDLAQPPKFDS